jgi:hypothetical protein
LAFWWSDIFCINHGLPACLWLSEGPSWTFLLADW